MNEEVTPRRRLSLAGEWQLAFDPRAEGLAQGWLSEGWPAARAERVQLPAAWETTHPDAEGIGFYRRTWEHSDATIDELALDAPGHVPWWPDPHPNTNLFAVMVHVLGESNRHAGHADILREGLDGRTGMRPEHEKQIDEQARAAHCAKIEQAARSAAPTEA